MSSDPLKDFVDKIPKVELHAHLNGCVSTVTLFELAKERGIELSDHHFSDDTARHFYNSQSRSLTDCFEVFVQIAKVVNDLPALRRITREALQEFADNRAAYLELRSTPKCLKRHWESEELTTKREYVETILQVFAEFEKEENKRWLIEKEQGVNVRLPLIPRFLVSINRGEQLQAAVENVDLAIELHENGNPYLVGMDMGGNPLQNDFRDFQIQLQRARTAGLKLTLHCGEVPCTDNKDRFEELEALLDFHPDRLGHALMVPESLRSHMARIPVETCPTSNVMTLELATSFQGHLVEGLRAHPQIQEWITHDYPFSVSTDDPGVFNTDPCKELLLLGMAWNLTPAQLQHVVLQSIDHAFCANEVKQLLKERMALLFDKASDGEVNFPNS